VLDPRFRTAATWPSSLAEWRRIRDCRPDVVIAELVRDPRRIALAGRGGPIRCRTSARRGAGPDGSAPVTTALGSIGEAMSDRVTGIVVQPDSPDHITDALTAAVTDEGLRVRLGGAARGRAGDFGLQRWYESLARLWTDLATFDRSFAVR
jgi:glycosyltransferase involved in cell wall biosynthesis